MPASRAAPGAPGGDVLVAEPDRAAGERPQAHDRVDQLGLAVALDAGDADDLALAHGEVDVVDERRGRSASATVTSSQLEDGASRTVEVAGLRRGQLGADHHLGELRGRSSSSGRPCRRWCRGG